jgi:hypothetical protein
MVNAGVPLRVQSIYPYYPGLSIFTNSILVKG